jgi:predicted  nucleic acid-binding Zn-ribbon protein
MAIEQKHLWLAAVAIAFVVAVAGFVGFRAVIGVKHDVAALGAKVEAANSTLADVKKTTSLDSTTAQLGLLDANLKKTDATLAQIQKSTALDGVKSALGEVNSKIESANAALGEMQKNNALGDIKTALASINAKIEQANGALSELQKNSALDDIKPVLASINSKIEQANGTLAQIQKAPAPTSQAQSADALVKLQASIDDLKGRIDGDATSLTRISDAVAKLGDAISSQGKPKQNAEDLVVFYVSAADVTGATAAATTASIASPIPPLAVHYERVGSLDDNGQTAEIVKKVLDLLKSRKGCAIAVTGHADTRGGDEHNLELSRDRASEVAAKLKTALAGQNIPISQAAWGERRLQVWTPDGRSNKANRTVEISLTCNG